MNTAKRLKVFEFYDRIRKLIINKQSDFMHYLWLFVLAGIWLIIAPFVLNYSETTAALWNDIVAGIIIAVVAIFGYSQKEE